MEYLHGVRVWELNNLKQNPSPAGQRLAEWMFEREGVMQTTKILRALFSLMILAVVGCSDATGPVYIASIEEFVDSQILPQRQRVEIRCRVLEAEIVFFRVPFGEPNDCPAGCFYSMAYGLQSGEKIGWMETSNISRGDPHGYQFYEWSATDTALFNEVVWSRLEKADRWIHWSAFLPELAADPDIPPATLQTIAERLRTYISPHIAWNLLDNPTVRQNHDILSVLAGLPEYQGDPYRLVRERAQELLDA
jgi:hypothetical protein